MNIPGTDVYITIEEVAQLLRLSKMSVYRLVHVREIPARKFGRSYRIHRDDLDAYIERAEYIPPTAEENQ